MTHEDIRYRVIHDSRASILRAIASIRNDSPETYSRLKLELDEYEQIIKKNEDIPLIIKNEKIIEDMGRPDIEIFGGRIIIEVKVKDSEFQSGIEQVSKYVKFYQYTQYVMITNCQRWEYYQVEKETLVRVSATDLDRIIKEVLRSGAKVPLRTENVRDLFTPIVLSEEELLRVFTEHGDEAGALFGAYNNIMKRLYEKASDEEITDLFMKHTLIQMIVSSCMTASSNKRTTPTRACSGAELEVEIALPYLNWWESLLTGKLDSMGTKFLGALLESIYSRSLLLDWESGNREDVFRELYEILIDVETRRKIGEYYTPLWIAEFMVNRLSESIGGLGQKVLLDPFCGSGTFLVTSFYKKIGDGEDPERAIREVIGFDINPLAVSIARAELTIAYQRVEKSSVTPLVFNIDSASLLTRSPGKWEPASFLDDLRQLETVIEYVDSPMFVSGEFDFSEILRLEIILQKCFKLASESRKVREELNSRLSELKNYEWKGTLIKQIVETVSENYNVSTIGNLIEKYGNGIWAVSITSLFAPHIIRKLKVDAIITNPPWAQLTEPKGPYGDLLREKARELLKGHDKTGQIIGGSDVSTILLDGCIKVTRNEVAFLMPTEVTYTASSYHGLGRILTFNVIKDYDGAIIEIQQDAFQHGRIPSMVFVGKRGGKISCTSMSVEWKGVYSKTLHLNDMTYNLKKGVNYEDYIGRTEAYTKISSKVLAEHLKVEEVAPMGDYMRGLLGGTEKRGGKAYAGLIFDVVGHDMTADQYSIKLSGTNAPMKIPGVFVDQYWLKIIYRGRVFPFYLSGAYNVLLSVGGLTNLKAFLRTRILDAISEGDKKEVECLIQEVRQPEKLKLLDRNKYYVIYRRMRTFASFVLGPDKFQSVSDNGQRKVVVSDSCSYLTLGDELKAHYYSAILNYLVYQVIEKKGAFERDQFARPVLAILESGLEWTNAKWQEQVAQFAKKLDSATPNCFRDFATKGMRVEACYDKLRSCDELKDLFENLISTIGNNTESARLLKSLELVSKLK